MTKPEITGIRDLKFSGWIREKLPDSSTGFLASDLDWILLNYKSQTIMLLEVKTRNAKLKEWQRKLFKLLDIALRKGLDKNWLYLGFHVLKFKNTFFDDGDSYFDGKLKTEDEIKSILSL